MSETHRIQRKRTKGWTMPPNTVYVGRPTVWGNPWRVVNLSCDCGSDDGVCWNVEHRCHTPEAAVKLFRANLGGIKRAAAFFHLRGKNLACWCPLDQPCHADVLLEIAND